MKLKVVADFLKGRSTIGELDQMPNRISHTFYYRNYLHILEMERNPKMAEAEGMANSLGSLAGL